MDVMNDVMTRIEENIAYIETKIVQLTDVRDSMSRGLNILKKDINLNNPVSPSSFMMESPFPKPDDVIQGPYQIHPLKGRVNIPFTKMILFILHDADRPMSVDDIRTVAKNRYHYSPKRKGKNEPIRKALHGLRDRKLVIKGIDGLYRISSKGKKQFGPSRTVLMA